MVANRLSDYALVSLDKVKDVLGLTENFDEDDTLILFINGATDIIERYIGFEVKSRERTETFSGDSSNIRFTLQRNISAVAKVVYNIVNSTDYEVPAASIKFDPAGIVYLDDSYAFVKGSRNCSITYTAGETTVPDDLQLAALITLKAFWQEKDKSFERVASVNVPGQTLNFFQEALPLEAQLILNQRRRNRFA